MNPKVSWAFVGAAGVFLVCSSFSNAAQIYDINFETEDDFVTPLVQGQSVYSTPRPNNVNPSVPFSTDTHLEFGRLIKVSSRNLGGDGNLGPAIFDSNPSDTPAGSTLDPDLLVGLGNVLILQRDEGPNTSLDPTHGLKFIHPNDEATPDDIGSLVFDFLVPNVHPMSIDLVDIDKNVHLNVILTDRNGRERTFAVPSNWTTDIAAAGPAGYQTLNLSTLLNQSAASNATGGPAIAAQESAFNSSQIARLEVQFLGTSISGAVDNLVFSVPEPGTMVLLVLGAAFLFVTTTRKSGRAA